MNKTAEKTLAMKARVFNEIRKDIYKKDKEARKYAPKDWTVLTEKEKAELFDKWFDLARESHYELIAYKSKRKKRKEIHEERLKSGYYEKKEKKRLEHAVNQIGKGITKTPAESFLDKLPILNGPIQTFEGKLAQRPK